MGWSGIWPASRYDAARSDLGEELRLALAERTAIVPTGTGLSPSSFARYDPLRATSGGWAIGNLAELQLELAGTLAASSSAWRWWDSVAGAVYDLPGLLLDSIGRSSWSRDLTSGAGGGWAAAEALIFNELRDAVSHLRLVRRISYASLSSRTASLYWLTWGGPDFATERADAFSQMQGQDDGVSTGLTFEVGLAGTVYDSYFDRQWYIESKETELRFDTSALAGASVSGAWLEISVAPAPGATDFADDFPIQVCTCGGAVRGSFNSAAIGVQQIALTAADIDAAGGGEAVLVLRSGRPGSADRPAWAATGADWSSNYREGVMIGDTVRLVVEVNFEYQS